MNETDFENSSLEELEAELGITRSQSLSTVRGELCIVDYVVRSPILTSVVTVRKATDRDKEIMPYIKKMREKLK